MVRVLDAGLMTQRRVFNIPRPSTKRPLPTTLGGFSPLSASSVGATKRIEREERLASYRALAAGMLIGRGHGVPAGKTLR